jgi:tripartite-type tricarboxylate transporter receptor subunit TctC
MRVIGSFAPAILTITTLAAGPALAAKDPLFAQCQSIRMIVPYTAGGGGDVGARLLAPYMAEDLGLPVQVENMPGAGSQTGVAAMLKAKADGCTIGWTHLPAVITIYLDKTRQAPFDRKSFAPVAMYVIDPGGLAVKGDSPYKDLADFVKAAKDNPGKVSISDSGVLSDGHLMILDLQRQSGAKFAIVHSAGGAEGTADLLGGHVAAQSVNLGGANVGMVQSGKMKMLATFTEKPVADYPGVKTATEQGFKVLSSTSRAISAPAGTPQPVVDRLSQSVGKSINNPEFRTKAAAAALTVTYMNAKATADYWDQMETTIGPLMTEAKGG